VTVATAASNADYLPEPQETKASFMSRLGLDERVPYHKALFDQMKVSNYSACSSDFRSPFQNVLTCVWDAE